MHTSLTVKNTVIGSGRTKIAVPLVARTAAELAAVLPQIKNLPFDIVEFRADFLECAGNIGEVLRHTQTVHDTLPDKPLLFTFRRHGEGGSFPCSDDYYFELLDALIESRLPDIIDIELFSGETAVRRAVANAQKNGIAALLCNHEFHRTPPQEEIVCRLKQMEDCGADICKIAVMPQSAEDVLTLLSATLKAKQLVAKPIVTMSMGQTGAVSRLAGQVFGSSITFGSGTQNSAPGQIGVSALRAALDYLESGVD